MITVPVLERHDQTKVIGSLTIDETKLPVNPDYVFTLGYRFTRDVTLINMGDWTEALGPHELCEVSLTSDASYVAYLRQVGKIHHVLTTENPES